MANFEHGKPIMVRISRNPESGEFQLRCEQWLPAELDDVFAFFSDATALETITPPWLKFQVSTPTPINMEAGTVIDYRLRVHGLPLRWRSEIPVWEPPHRFVDVQLVGPYRKWEHEHTFLAERGGTLVGDHVDYAVPGGSLIHALFVKRDLQRIFAYRQQALAERFGAAKMISTAQ